MRSWRGWSWDDGNFGGSGLEPLYAATPYGFDAIEGRLVEVKREAKVVAEILKQRNAGASLADIAESLNAQGIEGKRGGRWYASTVRYLIQRQTA